MHEVDTIKLKKGSNFHDLLTFSRTFSLINESVGHSESSKDKRFRVFSSNLLSVDRVLCPIGRIFTYENLFRESLALLI